MSGVVVDTGRRSHPNAAENCPNFHELPPAPSSQHDSPKTAAQTQPLHNGFTKLEDMKEA